MPAGKRISLGAAFFGCNPADGHYSPGQQVPDAWLLSLASYEGVLSGVFSSCRAGREWVLASARTAKLTLDTSTAQADEQAWRRRLDALHGHLCTRAQHQPKQGASLYILTTREQSTSPAFQLLPGLITAASGAMTFLSVKLHDREQRLDSSVLEGFLQRAAPGLTNLSTLSVMCGTCALPALALLPRLQSVYMDLPHDLAQSTVAAVLDSIRPYMGQLKHLTLGLARPEGDEPDSFPWYLLFPPATATAGTAISTVATAATGSDSGLPARTAPAAAASEAAAPAAAATGAAAAAPAVTVSSAAVRTGPATPTAAATAAAPHLLAFCTSYDLTDTLLTTLLHHAPNLKELDVSRIAIRGEYSNRAWSVDTLHVWFGVWDSGLVRLYEGMYMPTLVRLPVCDHENLLMVSGFERLKLTATSEEGLDASIRDRLWDFLFDVPEVSISPGPSLPLEDQSAALKSMLQQLSALGMVGGVVTIRGWSWTVDMFLTAAVYVPFLRHLKVQSHAWFDGPLTDQMRRGALLLSDPSFIGNAHLTHTLQLSDQRFICNFARLDLQSDQHSGAKWPFFGLTLRDTVNVADLVRLPRPDETTDAVLWCCKLVIDSRSITEVGTERLCAWLQHVKWSHPDTSAAIKPTMTVSLQCLQDDPAMQRAQLQVLRAMQLDTETDIQAKITVVLDGWQMTHTAMDVLSEGLPEWESQIDLSQASFTLQPSEYTHLAQCVPVSYKTWHTGLGFRSRVYDAVTEGISAHRQGLGLGRLMVTVSSAPGFWAHAIFVEQHYTVQTQHAPGGVWQIAWQNAWEDEWHV